MADEDDENWWIEEGIPKEDVDFVNALVASKVRQAPAEEIQALMQEAREQSKARGVEDFDEDLFQLAFYVTPPKPSGGHASVPGEPSGGWFNWEGFWDTYRKIEAGIEPDTEIGGGDDIRRVVERGAKRLDLARRGGAS